MLNVKYKINPGFNFKPGLNDLNNKGKGSSLYLGLLLIAVLMTVGFSLATLSFLQIKAIKGTGNSLISFFAADTAIEKTLYDESQGEDISICTRTTPCQGNLNQEIIYRVVVLSGGEQECSSDRQVCIETVGIFRETRRAIRISK